MKKRALSLALALAMSLALTVPALAAGQYWTGSGYTDDPFDIRDGKLRHYYGTDTKITVPDGVTTVSGITTGHVETPIVTDVTLPNSVTTIGTVGMDNPTLARINIPDSVIEIKTDAFHNATALTSIDIPAGLKYLGENAFYNCTSLTKVDFRATNVEIGPHTFEHCVNLTDLTLHDGLTNIVDCMFTDCRSLAHVTIPNSVTSIGERAFSSCISLDHVVIPNSVTSIGTAAFKACIGLTDITIPSSVTSIDAPFANCMNLTDIYYEGSEAQWNALVKTSQYGIWGYGFERGKPTIHYNSAMPGQPAQPQQPVQPVGSQAAPTNDKLTADGVEQNATVYKINGSNYFKIRDLAAVLNGTEKQFEVGYDKATKSVTATTGKGYTKGSDDLAGAASSSETATVSNDTIYVDGVKIQAEVYKIGGNNYFKLRDLGRALDFYVGYEKGKGMFIDTTKPYTE